MLIAQADTSILVTPPQTGVDPNINPSDVIGNAITIITIAVVILALFFIAWGAITWITSGGEKEKVAKAHRIIINTIIGIMILSLAFFVVQFIGDFLHFNLLNPGEIPTFSF